MLKQSELERNTPLRVIVLEQTDSTNRVAREMAAKGAPEGTAVFAIRQTGGRGRLGRSFESPAGGIYMSVILRPDAEPGQCVRMTMGACVGVCRALKGVLGIEAGIKWVNDIYYRGKKICGILAEGGISKGRLDCAVAGVGLNYQSPEFSGELGQKAGSLFPNGAPVDINVMAGALCTEVYRCAGALGDPGIYQQYRGASLVPGRRVKISGSGREALALDVTPEGFLLVRFDDGSTQALNSGEVSVKGNFYDAPGTNSNIWSI